MSFLPDQNGFFLLATILPPPPPSRRRRHFAVSLESEKQQEGHHKTEKPHGLRQGESENGVREELLLERGISGVADDERTEDGTDTGTGTRDANGCRAGADVLRRRIDIHRTG